MLLLRGAEAFTDQGVAENMSLLMYEGISLDQASMIALQTALQIADEERSKPRKAIILKFPTGEEII